MKSIENPILRGFNPDPSIVRVGADYYIATSTFEWFPGVQIHHSRDLIHWELVARPLNRVSQLDLIGVPDSCGVWAPCLSYHEGTFYLVFSNVRSFDGPWKDTPNYLVKSHDIRGKWSDPIFLSASGFDGSLFHDIDGRKWYTSMICDHRKESFFGGIILQEYSEAKEMLVGKEFLIWKGSELGLTEAPHICQRNGYYYLITAEGGTEYGHAVSLARSQSLFGPYETHPDNPLITSRQSPKAYLQKCGHADLVEAPDGNWYIVFLTGRPLTERGRCTLGRETAIEEVEWRPDNWLYPKTHQPVPRKTIPLPDFETPSPEITEPKSIDPRYSFDPGKTLSIDFQSLRIPVSKSWLSLEDRPGYARMYGRESLTSLHNQSLLARRVQHFQIEITTCLEFSPTTYQQMAGLICYYNSAHWHYLHVMGDEDGVSTYLQIISCDNFHSQNLLKQPVDVSRLDRIYLKAIWDHADIQFFYRTDEVEWKTIGPVVDGSILSDDYVREGSNRYRPAFTGAFVGMCCQDLSGKKQYADFNWFEYIEHHDQ